MQRADRVPTLAVTGKPSTLLPKSGGIMESDWSQGYVTEVLYTEHFFRELSPAWLNYVATINGCPF